MPISGKMQSSAPCFPAVAVVADSTVSGKQPNVLKGENAWLVFCQRRKCEVVKMLTKAVKVDDVCLQISPILGDFEGA